MDMDFDYHWQLNQPAKTHKVYLANHRADLRAFIAEMVLHRRPLTRGRIFLWWLRFSWMTGQVVFAIYCEAFRLWMKKCLFFPQPGNHHETPR